jgi:hypothetical protein
MQSASSRQQGYPTTHSTIAASQSGRTRCPAQSLEVSIVCAQGFRSVNRVLRRGLEVSRVCCAGV